MKYGIEPEDCGHFDVMPTEYQQVLCMPVKMPDCDIVVPENLRWTSKLLTDVITREDIHNKYIYLTTKYSFVEGLSANRPGWHADGFLSTDINYVWYDSCPTEFCIQDFSITEDHSISMKEMDEQADVLNIYTYPVKRLLRLDCSQIHRVPSCPPRDRAFCKITISEHKHNLEGNAHNYLLDYDWKMYARTASRNHPFVIDEQ